MSGRDHTLFCHRHLEEKTVMRICQQCLREDWAKIKRLRGLLTDALPYVEDEAGKDCALAVDIRGALEATKD